jgi:hypothetical protein
MQANRLKAIVAGTMGYRSGLEKKERLALFKAASARIEQIVRGELPGDEMEDLVKTTRIGIDAFDLMEGNLKATLEDLAKRLPPSIVEWVGKPEQMGFSWLSLAQIVGEAGDLWNYPTHSHLWRRMGCAPWEWNGETHMGSTWRYLKKLPSDQWEQYGYPPRRRSIGYVIGENLMRGNMLRERKGKKEAEAGVPRAESVVNGADPASDSSDPVEDPKVRVLWKGPYRLHYEQKRAEFLQAHPDARKGHQHLHGMLLAFKLLLKQLWCQWHGVNNPPRFRPERDARRRAKFQGRRSQK